MMDRISMTVYTYVPYVLAFCRHCRPIRTFGWPKACLRKGQRLGRGRDLWPHLRNGTCDRPAGGKPLLAFPASKVRAEVQGMSHTRTRAHLEKLYLYANLHFLCVWVSPVADAEETIERYTTVVWHNANGRRQAWRRWLLESAGRPQRSECRKCCSFIACANRHNLAVQYSYYPRCN